VVGSTVLKEYLINTARPFIYTTALPPHALLTLSSAFSYLADRPQLLNQLRENVALFSSVMAAHPAYANSDSAIQRVMISGNENVNAVALHLRGKGFDVRPIRKPTVPEGSERIRICLHAFNTSEDIIRLAQELNKLNIAPRH
jgi:8-amino-7-oxononanoate synthase